MTSYYYRRLGQTLGPYDLHRMKQLARRKAFGYTSDVSTDGVVWKKGREFPELFESASAPDSGGAPSTGGSDGKMWSYIKDGVEHKNAASLSAIQTMVRHGQLASEDLVWSEDYSDWVAVADCTELVDCVPLLSPPREDAPAAAEFTALKGPAIALIVSHGVGVLALLLSFAYNLLVSIGSLAMPTGDGSEVFGFFIGTFGMIFNCLALVATVVALVAAIMMLRMKSWGFSLTGAILSVIPCLNGCCLLSMPFGIWAIVILMKDETKAAFRAG